jgi:hypothetical protein
MPPECDEPAHRSASSRRSSWRYCRWKGSRGCSFVSLSFSLVTRISSHMSRYGASDVWVGTRFVAASEEAGAPKKHKDELLAANYDDVIRTTVYTRRPMNVRKTSYVVEWYRVYHFNDVHCRTMPTRETTRKQEHELLLKEGKIPNEIELQSRPERSMETRVCE